MTRHFRRSLLVALCLTLTVAAGCGFFGRQPSPEEERQRQEDDRKCQTDKVRLEVAEVGSGAGGEARPGRRIAVHYTGWLFHPDKPGNHGRQFDSSRDRGEPIEFTLGQGEVIPGWDQGISGMKVGAKRTLVIPANLAYGRGGNPPLIPANATLVFDVELTAVK
jgi:FKBP-type peptidyl-prolyl cis-trans isomerase FkpA